MDAGSGPNDDAATEGTSTPAGEAPAAELSTPDPEGEAATEAVTTAKPTTPRCDRRS